MWIIIPGQRLDEQETLTHNTLMQPAETGGREGGRDGVVYMTIAKHFI